MRLACLQQERERGEGNRTQSKARYPPHITPDGRIRDLPGDSFHCSDCNEKRRGAERDGVEKEFVHDHVHDHNYGEEREEDSSNESGVLGPHLESEDAVQERSCQEVHG